ncbi:DNA polymerase III subunit gamma/tau [Rheinheimera sp.]|uniref:DNA polymerase III subunit gamma/tau n=1 Tax=Rheinheimera sp. TaxID=1869214 RepID=UPI003AF6CB29
MSYQVLARKWRPQQFAELVGQDHVKAALGNALANNRLHHAYLFTGTRGVGKTTIARIFAKSLNCETGITATPCGQCSTCKEIEQGFYVDLLEIDAASRTKVEDTRDLLDNVQYAPSRGRYKVYLIDEVHMLSRHSFNALLKTLEEPPPHVKFLLATTDPQKLPVTVLSRCLQFSLKALSPEQIKQHLAYVLTQEALPYDDEALALLSRAAKGSLRDSLSLTDQAIAQGNAQVRLPVVRDMLGYLEQSWAELLLKALLERDAALLQQTLDQLVQQHSQFSAVLDDMLAVLHLAALSQFNWQAAELSAQNSEFIRQVAEQVSPEVLQLYYQLLISGKKELAYAPEPRIGLEMALLRALAFVPAEGSQAEAKTVVSQADQLRARFNLPTATAQTAAAAKTEPAALAEPVVEPSPEAEPMQAQNPGNPAPAVAEQPAAVSATASILARRGFGPQAGAASPAETPPAKKSEAAVAAPVSQRQEPADAEPAAVVTPVPAVTNTVVTETAVAAVPVPAAVVAVDKVQAAPQSEVQAADEGPPWDLGDVQAPAATAVSQAAQTPVGDSDFQAAHDDADETDPLEFSAAELDMAADWAWQQQQEQAEPAAPAYQFDGVITAENFSVRLAAQVDRWAALVDGLALGGLMRLYLLHSSIEWQQDTALLTVCQSQSHLDKPRFRQELAEQLSQAFNKALQLQIQYQDWVDTCPVAIQQRIEQERRVYVKELLQTDPNVLALQQLFQAELLPDTIVVN